MNYTTSDTQEVACLIAIGEKIVRIINDDPKRIGFEFADSDTIDENVEFFSNRELFGNLRDVLDAHKNIKKRIFAIKDITNPL